MKIIKLTDQELEIIKGALTRAECSFWEKARHAEKESDKEYYENFANEILKIDVLKF